MSKKTLPPLPNHLGIYIRVSTQQQKNEGISTHDQRESGIAKANQLGWTYSIYDDSAQSGSISYLDRPGMSQLMTDVGQRKLGGMFSVDIDRWSRDKDYEEPQIIITIFKKSGIKIFTPSGELNLQDPGMEFMSRIQGLTSSFYRIQTQNKIKRSLLQSANEGKASGGPFQPYGYSKKNKILVVNEKEREVVELIFKMYLNNKGTFVIADELNKLKIPTKRNSSKKGRMTITKSSFKSISGEIIPERKIIKEASEFIWRDKTILGILKNPVYKGERNFKNTIVKSPIIIQPEIFDAVQVVIEEKKKFKSGPYANQKKVNRFLLKGLVKCSKCGQSFYGKKRKDLKDNAYCCLSQRYKEQFCGTQGISIDYLDNLVWSEIKKMEDNVNKFFDRYEKDEAVISDKATLKETNNRIEEYNEHLKNLNRRSIEGKITDEEFNPLRDEYLKELNELKEIKTFHERRLNTHKEKESVKKLVKDLSDSLKTNKEFDFDERQSIIKSFVDTISIMFGVFMGTNYYLPKGHTIFIKYKITNLTEIMLAKEIEIGYKNNGYRIGIVKENLIMDQVYFTDSKSLKGVEYISHLTKDPQKEEN